MKPKIYNGQTLPARQSSGGEVTVSKKQEIFDFFSSAERKEQIKQLLPRVGITADRMVRLLFSAIAQDNKLVNCAMLSLYNCIIQAAQLGLEPNTSLGHAYLVPFKSEATLIIGYKGLIWLAHMSERFRAIYAQEVYPDDEFQIELGLNPDIRHIPAYNDSYQQQDIVGCYAVAELTNGAKQFEYMTKGHIESIRARSHMRNGGAWVSDYVMMARKTVIKRLMHYLPLTNTMAQALQIDGENEVMPGTVEPPMIEEEQQKDEPPQPSAEPQDDIFGDKAIVARKKIGELAARDGIEIDAISAALNVKTLHSVPTDKLLEIINVWEEFKTNLRTFPRKEKGGQDEKDISKETSKEKRKVQGKNNQPN